MTTARLPALLLALLAPMLLLGCVVTPGKFVSTLTIGADRSFAYSYRGEVHALDLGKAMRGLGDPDTKEGTETTTPTARPAAWTQAAHGTAKTTDAGTERKNAAIAEALRKEPGFARVDYKGGGVFDIDYAIRGTLTHGFVWPFNLDAEIIVPFIALELRGRDMVRVKAPAFAGDTDKSGGMAGAMSGSETGADKLDGTFTLTTDAEIVSQNSEDGAVAAAGGRTISWRATPLTKDAPMAMLRMKAL